MPTGVSREALVGNAFSSVDVDDDAAVDADADDDDDADADAAAAAAVAAYDDVAAARRIPRPL